MKFTELYEKNVVGEAKETATSEYKRQSAEVIKNIKIITDSWKQMKKKLDAQQKENPDRWEGIGNGSELGTIVEFSKDFAEVINRIK